MNQEQRQEKFQQLSQWLQGQLQGGEQFLLNYAAEDSDFIRLNASKIRQAGSVAQSSVFVDLIRGQRHAGAHLTLADDADLDQQRLQKKLRELRAMLGAMPEDPYLLYCTENASTACRQEHQTPDTEMALEEIQASLAGADVVGVYASGGLHRGFANSLGQRNWHSNTNFNFDWSRYLKADKAVKSSYAGFAWNSKEFQAKVAQAEQEFEVLSKPAATIQPGHYRVYLAPAAVNEIVGLLCWGGFGIKAQRTKQTPLLSLLQGESQLHSSVTLTENTAQGVAPNFQEAGFLRPDQVSLIQNGVMSDCLVSPRSAREFDVPTNGATSGETPLSLDLESGALAAEDILPQLDRGIFINSLFYLNYSDRMACRTTGMTRFATFLVEGGKVTAPLNVMRFDESVYRMFGDNLVGLTQQREFLLDPSTYYGRSVGSSRLPGALVEDFTLTL